MMVETMNEGQDKYKVKSILEDLKINKINENTFYVFSENGLFNKKTGYAEWSWGAFKTFEDEKKEIKRLLKVAQ